MKITSTNKEMTVLGGLSIISTSSKNVKVANVCPSISFDKEGNIDDVNTLVAVLKAVYSLATTNKKVCDYFEVYKSYGIFTPSDIKEVYFSTLRRAENNAIYVCTNISNPYYSEDGLEVVDYDFKIAFLSEVAMSQTALAMKKATIEALATIKHEKGWRNAARGLRDQLKAVSIKKAIIEGREVSHDLEEVENDVLD